MGPSSPASPASPSPGDLHEDFAFSPEDDKLLAVYLRSKIAGKPIRGAAAKFFHDADVYATEPATLVGDFAPAPPAKGEGDSWFFFCPERPRPGRSARVHRTIAGGEAGTWHAETAKKVVVDRKGRAVGYKKSFTHKAKNGEKSGWLMKEFGVDQEEGKGGGGGVPAPVLCKIYQSPRALQSTSKSGSSSSGSARKRNATDERHDQAASSAPSMRRRLFFPSPASPTSLPAVAEAETDAEPSQGKITAAVSGYDFSCSNDDRAAPALGCHDTTLLIDGDVPVSTAPWAPDAAAPVSWTMTPPMSGDWFLGGFPVVEEHCYLTSAAAGFGQDASSYLPEMNSATNCIDPSVSDIWLC